MSVVPNEYGLEAFVFILNNFNLGINISSRVVDYKIWNFLLLSIWNFVNLASTLKNLEPIWEWRSQKNSHMLQKLFPVICWYLGMYFFFIKKSNVRDDFFWTFQSSYCNLFLIAVLLWVSFKLNGIFKLFFFKTCWTIKTKKREGN